MFRERGNAVLAEDPDQPSSSSDDNRPSRKARRRVALKAVEEARTPPSPTPLFEAPTAPPAEEPAATPDIQTETTKPTDAELAPPAPRRSLRMLILMFGAVAALAAAAWYGHYYWTVGQFYVSTDDAYVGAKTATIGAKVSGYVTEVAIDDNAHVRAGDVMVRIDDGDYQLAVQTAKDNVATEQATIDRIGKQIEAQSAAVDQAKAQLASAQAGLTRAELELQRQQALSVKDFASHQTLEQAQAGRDQAVAAVQSAEAGVEAAEANVQVLKGQQNEAENTLKQLETVLAKAERDLSFTVIRAPFDGVMGN
ncbi:MAG: biotin/lipoyl-binding protein, partial [Methyloceanibacter sp.]